MVGLLSPLLMGPAQTFTPMAGPATGNMGGGMGFPAPPPAPQQRGLGGFLSNFNMPDQATRLQMAAQMMAGRNLGESLGGAFGVMGQSIAEQRAKREEAMRNNATLEYFKSRRPDLYEAVAVGMDPKEAFKIALQGGPDLTDDLKEYQFAQQQGFNGSFTDYMTEMKKAGASTNNITVGGGRYGTIPQGYELIEGPQGATLRAIPGGPEDTSQKDLMRAGQAQVTSDVVLDAANKARQAMNEAWLPTTGTFGNIAANLSESGAAEVRRQVEALKAVAASENINAMRQASPTGGALGNASDADIKLLKDKAGALDPGSPNFLRDLEDYERTLLRIVHGPAAGDAIYQQTRQRQGGTADPLGIR